MSSPLTTMKCYAIAIVFSDEMKNKILHWHDDIAEVSFWSRSLVRSALQEAVLEITPQVSTETFIEISYDKYHCHALKVVKPNKVFKSQITIMVLTDEKYSPRIAKDLILSILEDYTAGRVDLPATMSKNENAEGMDKIIKINRELETTKNIMLNNINKILERGESLEKLHIKATDLELRSRVFREKTENLNSCCSIL